MSLSARFHGADQQTVDRMRRQIVSSVRAGETVTRVAERLLDLDKPIVRLPQHVRELRDAAQMALYRGDRNIYLDAVQKWRARVEQLGQGPEGSPGAHTMRSATQQLVKDLGSAKLEQIDHIAERWVLDRARHQARVIARTETVEAFRDVYKETTAKQPYVVGYRWQLSGSHPRPDECDVFASQDVDGIGPGGYLPSNVPSSPHPHDLCSQVAIIDNQFFKRELAKKTGAEDPPRPWESGQKVSAKEWLAKQPQGFQRQLLGPTLHKAFGAGRNVLDAQGKPLPVHVVLGRPKPERTLGPAVDASAAVARDRRSQVQPFPKVAGAPRAPKLRRAAKPTRVVALAREQRQRALGNAWATHAQDGGRAVRTQTRAFLADKFRLAPRTLPAGDKLAVTNQLQPNAAGQFEWDGEVKVRVKEARGVDRAMSQLRTGGALSNDDIGNVKLLVHEEVHGHGPLTAAAYRAAVGQLVEEVATETVARVATRELLGLKGELAFYHQLSFPELTAGGFRAQGPYGDWIAHIAENVQQTTQWAQNEVFDAIKQASLAFKRHASEIQDPTAFARQWVSDVPKLTEAQQETLLQKLHATAKRVTHK